MKRTAKEAIKVSNESDGAFFLGKVKYENFDSTLTVTNTEDGMLGIVPMSDVRPLRCFQARLPASYVKNVMKIDEQRMRTPTRYYILDTMRLGKARAQPTLLDQAAVDIVLKTCAPTLDPKICSALSFCILCNHGLNADLNQDGVISPSEWEALEALFDDRIAKTDATDRFGTTNKQRLVHLVMDPALEAEEEEDAAQEESHHHHGFHHAHHDHPNHRPSHHEHAFHHSNGLTEHENGHTNVFAHNMPGTDI